MAQVSRPFQIGIAAVAVLACVWLFALRGHSTSNEPSSSGSAPTQAAKAPSSSTHITAPGVAGLTKDVEKAHAAVATSERNASELQKHSEAASDERAASGSTASTPASTPSAKGATSSRTPSSSAAAAPRSAAAATSVRDRAIEARLAGGGVVLILFWNPKSAVDASVFAALHRVSARNVSLYYAAANQVASFGSLTKSIQVFQTPTLVVVGPSHQARVVTGLTNPYVVEQTISEARASH